MAELGHSSDPAQPAGSDTSWVIDPTRTEEIERTVADYVETLVASARTAHGNGEVLLARGIDPDELLTFGTFVLGPNPT